MSHRSESTPSSHSTRRVTITNNLESLHVFVPDELLLALSNVDDMLGIEAGFTTTSSCFLFVDVKGFSDVANRLQSMSNNTGSEVLTEHLNIYFSQIVDVVVRHEGDVLLFSGDALLARWDSVSERSASLAMLCGMSLLTEAGRCCFTVRNTQTDMLEEFTLTLHIGGSAGEVTNHIVGGACSSQLGRWKYVVIGKPIEFAGAAANMGSSGEFFADMALVRLVSPLLQLKGLVPGSAVTDIGEQDYVKCGEFELAEGFPYHPRSGSAPDRLERPETPNRWKRRAILASREAVAGFLFDTMLNLSAAEGQLRTVSTVFVKLGDFGDTSNAMKHQMLHKSVRIIQKALRRVQGVLNKVVTDDKGIIAICLFGIPGYTHEDDATRSVMFSAKIAKKLAQETAPPSIGVARANVFCGLTGGDQRKEYTVLGDGVNLAARLMGRCDPKKAEVISDADTAVAASSTARSETAIAFAPAGEVLVKGRDRPVTIFYVTESVENPAEKAPVLTREMSPSAHLSHSFGSSASLGGPRGTQRTRRALSKGSHASSCSSFGSLFSIPSVYSLQLCKAKKFASRRSPRRNESFSSGGEDDLGELLSEGSIPLAPILDDETGELIGREVIVAAMQEFCHADEPTCLTLDGLHQVGKSRLLKRAKEIVAATGMPFAILRGSTGARNMASFESVREFATAAARSTRFDTSDPAERRHSMILNYVIKSHKLMPPSGEVTHLTPSEKLEACNEALMWLFVQSRSESLFLLADDIDEVDYATASFIMYAVQQRGARLICCKRKLLSPLSEVAWRTPQQVTESGSSLSTDSVLSLGFTLDLAPRLPDLERLVRDTDYTVEPLPKSSNDDLLQVLCGSEIDPMLLQRVFDITNGVCGYTVSVMQYLIASSKVQHCLGQVVLHSTLTEAVVSHVSGVEANILRVRDSLDTDLHAAVNAAVVLCVRGSVNLPQLRKVLLELSPQSDPTKALKDLCGVPFVTVSGDTLTFFPSLARDAVYISMLGTARRDLHRCAVEVLRADPAAEAHSIEILLHCQFSHLPVTFDMSDAASMWATQEGDYPKAVDHVSSACDLCDVSVDALARGIAFFNQRSLAVDLGSHTGAKPEEASGGFLECLETTHAAADKLGCSMQDNVDPPPKPKSRRGRRNHRRKQPPPQPTPRFWQRVFCCCADTSSSPRAQKYQPPVSDTPLVKACQLSVEQRAWQDLRRAVKRLQCEAGFFQGDSDLCGYYASLCQRSPVDSDRRVGGAALFLLQKADPPEVTTFESPLCTLAAFSRPDVSSLIVRALDGRQEVQRWPTFVVAGGRPRLMLTGAQRQSVLASMLAARIVCQLLQGDPHLLETIDRLRSCRLPKWSLLALLLKSAASYFVQLRGQHLCRTNCDVPSVNGSEVSEPSYDALLAPLISATQNPMGDIDVAAEQVAQQVAQQTNTLMTPFHAVASIHLLDRLLPCCDRKENVGTYKQLLEVLRKAASRFPLFMPCLHLYEGSLQVRSPDTAEAGVSSLETCADLCHSRDMQAGYFSWRARASLLIHAGARDSPNRQKQAAGLILEYQTKQLNGGSDLMAAIRDRSRSTIAFVLN